jgi:uncharacterized protein HemX
MTEQPPPRSQNNNDRRAPQSTVQAAGLAARDVIRGLTQNPVILGLVVLNVIGIGAAVWIMHELLQAGQERYMQLMRECFTHFTPR